MADTGFKSPTATGEDYNQWTNPTYAYADDSNYATESTAGEEQDYYNFNFGVPAGATINGVEVTIKGYCGGDFILNGDGCNIKVDISDDGGITYGNKIQQGWVIASGEPTNTWGGPTDGDAYWGLTLTDTDFSNANFRVRVEMDRLIGGGTEFDMNHIQVKVYYTAAPGGGAVEVQMSGDGLTWQVQ